MVLIIFTDLCEDFFKMQGQTKYLNNWITAQVVSWQNWLEEAMHLSPYLLLQNHLSATYWSKQRRPNPFKVSSEAIWDLQD